jgi:hypothetical protein
MAGFLEQIMGGGGAAAPPADLPPSMPDPEAGAAAAAPAGGDSEVATLKNMLGLANEYKAMPTTTEQESAQMEQVTSIIQKLLASNESMTMKSTGATPELKKAFGGAGGV